MYMWNKVKSQAGNRVRQTQNLGGGAENSIIQKKFFNVMFQILNLMQTIHQKQLLCFFFIFAPDSCALWL